MSINLGLERIQKLLSLITPYTRPTIHVAGTNGKGSTVAILESILRHSGFKTGKFNSPHLIRVRDSICINGEEVDVTLYEEVSRSVREVDQLHQIGASNFEVLTAIALMVFERTLVDVVVLEVGMGGRLDATNAIPQDCILISGMTTVDLDHQAFLGNTVAEIAREKAAICKAQKTLVVGEQRHEVVYNVVSEVVDQLGGQMKRSSSASTRSWEETIDGPEPLHFSVYPFQPPAPRPIHFQSGSYGDLNTLFPLQGEHQLANLSLALDIVEQLRHQSAPWNGITNSQIAQGVRHVRWPGRLEWFTMSIAIATTPKSGLHQLTLLADGAHNAGSAHVLAQYLSRINLQHPRTFIISLSHSPPKTPKDPLEPLLQAGDVVVVVPFSPVQDMPWVKPTDPNIVAEEAGRLVQSRDNVLIEEDIEKALVWCCQRPLKELKTPVIVAGSLYLVADLYRLREKARFRS